MNFKEFLLQEKLNKKLVRTTIKDFRINPPNISNNCKAVYIPETKDLFTFDQGEEHIYVMNELKANGLNFQKSKTICLNIEKGIEDESNRIDISSIKWRDNSEYLDDEWREMSNKELERRTKIIEKIPQIQELRERWRKDGEIIKNAVGSLQPKLNIEPEDSKESKKEKYNKNDIFYFKHNNNIEHGIYTGKINYGKYQLRMPDWSFKSIKGNQIINVQKWIEKENN